MTKDRAASLLFLCSGIYGFYYSVQLPMGRWNEPGPGIFPFTLSNLRQCDASAGGFAETGEILTVQPPAACAAMGSPR